MPRILNPKRSRHRVGIVNRLPVRDRHHSVEAVDVSAELSSQRDTSSHINGNGAVSSPHISHMDKEEGK